MSGYIARKGFLFQDHYLLIRVLRAASDSLDSAWQTGATNVLNTLSGVALYFGLEASPSNSSGNSGESAGLDWDVLILGNSRLEFAEVKSGVVSKNDRITFWQRLRRELTRDPQASTLLVPILVVDPTKIEGMEKWSELTQIATSSSACPPPFEPKENVFTATQLLNEALWWMCHLDGTPDHSNPPVGSDTAIAALSRFELHCHEAHQLELQVMQFIELLFPGGITESQQALMLGWLSKRATSPNVERRLFSIRDLLSEIGVLQDSIALSPGTIKEWRDLWNEAPIAVRSRTRMCLGNAGASVPAARVQATALNALTNNGALVVLARGGAGKSTFVAQVAADSANGCNELLHCGAADINSTELEKLTNAIRFRAALIALIKPAARLFLCIDGLDETDVSLRERWAQVLVRLHNLPNVRSIVSMRDNVWRGDGQVRRLLESWTTVSLDLWPESLIRELLEPTPFHNLLPATVIDLLRTPILLDIFWRTFVEVNTVDVSRASRLQTRHSLLAAFWEERLLTSPRYADVPIITRGIMNVVSTATNSIGGFSDENMDAKSLQILLAEGVLVREGHLKPRVQFRHPLLRDFAFSQWCIDTSDLSEVSRRWNAIRGGLQRHGALRAIIEALTDSEANADYPQLTLEAVVQEIVISDSSLASQVAHILGTREPIPALDPSCWPSEIQSSLPSEFARDLLSAARLDGNVAWAGRLSNWPDAAKWMNKDYASEVWNYASFLENRAKANPNNSALREQSRQAARKLRSISEAPEFATEFSECERWLKMQAMICVIPILSDEATFAWVEREMAHSSWRTRSSLLEQLIHLARVDAQRTAIIYRQAVNLSENSSHPTVDASFGSGVMDHQAIEWSLAGKDGRQSLLNEYPAAFLPVALDLAEALWMLKQGDPENRMHWEPEIVKQFDPAWSEDAYLQRERERQLHLGDLIDDSPGWRRLQYLPSYEPFERCLDAVRSWAEQCSKVSTSTLARLAAVIRSSRMASAHMILLNVLLDHPQEPEFQEALRDCVLDSRLYYISGFEDLMELGLTVVWPMLAAKDRLTVYEQLRCLLKDPETEDYAKHLLARLPLADLPENLRRKRPNDDDESYKPWTRRIPADHPFDQAWVPVESADDCERLIGQWPDAFNRDLLIAFAHATSPLFKQDTSTEKLGECACHAIEVAKALLPVLHANLVQLDDTTHFWVWNALTKILDCFRKSDAAKKGESPSSDVIIECAEIALAVLKDVPTAYPGSLPDGDVWVGFRETAWGDALKLADAALTWPPMAEDKDCQARFVEVIQTAFYTGNPLLQLVCTTAVRPWHWQRDAERRQLQDRLVWNLPKHASVLAWSLSRIQDFADIDRAKVLRLLLSRSDVVDAKQLAHNLGQYIGIGSMHIFINGQRSAVAEIARESINTSEVFPLLQDLANRSEFMHQFMFGMKEQAKLMSAHVELAPDYGNWALKVWRAQRAQRKKRMESEGIVLFATYWLAKIECEHRNLAVFKPWWHHLQELFKAVIREGGRSDCFMFFFSLRDGKYNDLGNADEFLELIAEFVDRIYSIGCVAKIDLQKQMRDKEEFHSWHDCAEYAAEAIESLRDDGSLTTELQREKAYTLLSTLAAEPIRASQAITAIYHLHND